MKKHVNHSKMRGMNLSLLLDNLRRHAPVSRAELSALTGINRATISNSVKTLIEQGIVKELGFRSGADVGAPSVDLAINPNAGRIIGCEMGGDFISIGVCDLAGKLYQTRDICDPLSGSDTDLITCLINSLEEVYHEALAEGHSVLGLGVTLPGLVEIESGIVLSCPLFDWYDFPLGEKLSQRFPIPIYIGNVSHMAALGESYFGVAKNSQHVLYIYVGTGISGSYLIDGEVLPGATNIAGEIGKMELGLTEETLDMSSSNWESLADQNALIKRMEQLISDGLGSQYGTPRDFPLTFSVDKIQECIGGHDPVVLQALDQTAFWLGVGMSNLVNIFNPEMVVIAGPFVHFSEYLFPKIDHVIQHKVLPWHREVLVLCPTAFSKFGGSIGAAATVFWEILHNPEKWF